MSQSTVHVHTAGMGGYCIPCWNREQAIATLTAAVSDGRDLIFVLSKEIAEEREVNRILTAERDALRTALEKLLAHVRGRHAMDLMSNACICNGDFICNASDAIDKAREALGGKS